MAKPPARKPPSKKRSPPRPPRAPARGKAKPRGKPSAPSPAHRRSARPPPAPAIVEVDTGEERPRRAGRAFPIEIDPRQVEETLRKMRDELSYWAKKGRYTRVRFKFRGKQILPDLPLAAVVAAEGLTFYWGGVLRALIVNFAGKTMFDVELVNDSDKHIQKGKEALLSGDVDGALEHFRAAIDMERDNPRAHLNVGIALKLKGDYAGARAALEQARALDRDGPAGGEAERVLATLPGPGPDALAVIPPVPSSG